MPTLEHAALQVSGTGVDPLEEAEMQESPHKAIVSFYFFLQNQYKNQ